MPKNNSALLQKFTTLLKFSIFLAKLKKPVIPKLVFLKKMRKLKKFKQHSYYGYVKEYEFSTSGTPLIQFRRKAARNGRTCFKKLYSDVFFISRCLGMERGGTKEMYCLETGVAPLPRIETIDSSNSWSEDESVDERAERFIQRFYEEMTRQRQECNFQLNAMLEM